MINDTIVAISTPLGEGGIGIVRISGTESIKILDNIFKGKIKGSEFKSHTIHYGKIVNPSSKEVIDTVLVTVMHAPQTYTREDVVEINAHGGSVLLHQILRLVVSYGARLAEPGEFTKRAFLNGRIDLTQAEAVIDVIKAKTEAEAKVAIAQLEGRLGKQIYQLKNNLQKILVLLEATIDFPEEDDVIIPHYTEIVKDIVEVQTKLKNLLETVRYGKILREGINTVIIGRPNVGKSSLLNALIGEDRAIVTHIPGTTRDVISEIIDLDGISLNISDTAGIRSVVEPIDFVEEEGIRRAKKTLEYAELVIIVLDGTYILSSDDIILLKELKRRKGVIVINKSDLPAQIDTVKLKSYKNSIVNVSATTFEGIDELKKTIKRIFIKGEISVGESIIITNIRHEIILKKVEENLDKAVQTINLGESFEFVALYIQEALYSIGNIVGETTPEDILNEIFSQFCIGK